MQTVEPSRDLNALAGFLPVYIERAVSQAELGLAARRKALRIATAVNPERERNRDSNPSRDSYGAALSFPVPYAFERWIAHLAWLDQLSKGIELAAAGLTPGEAQGLALLRQAREKFWSEHTSCFACSSVNLRNAKFCGDCGKDL